MGRVSKQRVDEREATINRIVACLNMLSMQYLNRLATLLERRIQGRSRPHHPRPRLRLHP